MADQDEFRVGDRVRVEGIVKSIFNEVLDIRADSGDVYELLASDAVLVSRPERKVTVELTEAQARGIIGSGQHHHGAQACDIIAAAVRNLS